MVVVRSSEPSPFHVQENVISGTRCDASCGKEVRWDGHAKAFNLRRRRVSPQQTMCMNIFKHQSMTPQPNPQIFVPPLRAQLDSNGAYAFHVSSPHIVNKSSGMFSTCKKIHSRVHLFIRTARARMSIYLHRWWSVYSLTSLSIHSVPPT